MLGSKLDLREFATIPAKEKFLSLGVLVIGMGKTFLAKIDKSGICL